MNSHGGGLNDDGMKTWTVNVYTQTVPSQMRTVTALYCQRFTHCQ